MGTPNQGPGTAERERDTEAREIENGPGSAAPPNVNRTLGRPTITRRGFLGAAAAGVAAAAIPKTAHSLVSHPWSPALAPQPVGLQLYTLRDLMQKDVQLTLRQVAAVGYREVEFAGLFNKDPKTVAKWLAADKLKSPSSHIPLDRLKKDVQGAVDEAKTLGNDYIVCPWIDAAMRKSADDWRRIGADLNHIGETVQRAGLRFAYHNHDFEFEKLSTGEMGYDILLKDCDPKLVKMEMDLYWITKGGQDPLAYFAKWPGRFPLVHVKDMGGKGDIVNVGQGHIDWPHIFSKRREAGIEHFIVERDNPTSPLEDIKTSYTYMAKLGL
ncbi:MAG: sugar phosphate isomerase/epimerase family protein [Myxococcales bacterium]